MLANLEVPSGGLSLGAFGLGLQCCTGLVYATELVLVEVLRM